MRVKDFIKMYAGINRVKVEIYASVTVFSQGHYVLVATFELDCARIYSDRKENYLSEEVTGFEVVNNTLRIMIRGCE